MQAVMQLLGNPALPSIRTIGFSPQRFLGYRNQVRDLHSHDVVELFFVLDGEGTHLVEEGGLPLGRGDLGIVAHGQRHCIVTSTPMDIVNLYLDPARAGLPPLSAPLSAALPRILPLAAGLSHKLNQVQQYRLTAADRVAPLLLALCDEAESRRPEHLEAMKLYLRLFLIECARFAHEHFRETAGVLSGPMASVERVRRHLDENWREEIELDALAARARMSKAHLCRIFRRYTGRTIIEYLHHRRVEQAMILLDSTDQKVISIAHESGFGDLAHFNRIFRRIAGMTPTDFRERARGSDESSMEDSRQ